MSAQRLGSKGMDKERREQRRAQRTGVSIREVAAQAGVSLSTVSQVLNGNDKARIALETQERVRRVARELGYRPNGLARGLVRGRTDTIGAMISALSNPYFVELLEAVEAHAEAAGYQTMLDSAPATRGSYGRHGRLSHWPVDGVLMWTRDGHQVSDYLDSAALGLPTVYLGGQSRDQESDHAGYDLRLGARAIAEHAIACCRGRHKYLQPRASGAPSGEPALRLAHLMPYDFARLRPQEERFVAFGEVAGEHRLPIEPLLPPEEGETREAGFAAAALILERPPERRPHCVLCHNDAMALGLLAGLLRGGLRVPDDISITGFDGISEGRFAPRALSTMACPPDALARLAIERLLLRLGPGKSEGLQHILLQPQLVPGETL